MKTTMANTKGAATVYTNTRSCPPGFPKHASNPAASWAMYCAKIV